MYNHEHNWAAIWRGSVFRVGTDFSVFGKEKNCQRISENGLVQEETLETLSLKGDLFTLVLPDGYLPLLGCFADALVIIDKLREVFEAVESLQTEGA